MAIQKPMMIMGGSLPDQVRQSTRASARSEVMNALNGNKFSSLMDNQSRPSSPQGEMQAVRTRTLAGLAKAMDTAGNAGDPMQDALAAQSIQAMVGALNQDLSSREPSYARHGVQATNTQLTRTRDVIPTVSRSPRAAQAAQAARLQRQISDRNHTEALGQLSARFESGKDGIAAIGYDRVGGTSYGKYQIASGPGSMDRFLNFLGTEAPDIAKQLTAAGPANTGSRDGDMPRAWRDIAAKQPERFAALQEQFIHETHYSPALEAVGKAGFKTTDFSPALKEVLWSTSVQHGPAGAARIFIQAAEKAAAAPGRNEEGDLIRGVYANRAGQFRSSTPSVRAAVHDRLQQEQYLALAMSDSKRSGIRA